MNIQDQIKKDISDNKIMLFIKGEKGAPQCGFSSAVLKVFEEIGADYSVKNVLADPELREGIKAFTNWPTIPQVFVNGQFIGGCDIVREMHANGELKALIQPN